MKIAIPVDETKEKVCPSFGRAPYFLVYDEETGGRALLDNPGAGAQGGAGLKAAQFIVDTEVDVLITVRCGENAAKVFQAVELKILEAEGLDVESNLQACQTNQLEELTHFHAGHHKIQ